jgi:RNA polymerase sigma-70 factor (ECF subfamily)
MDSPADFARTLAERIALGSRDAERELVAVYYRPLLARLRKKLSSRAAAEDICQESFVIAINKLRRGSLRDSSKVGAFVTGIAERLALAHSRANRIGALTDQDPDTLEALDHRPPEVLERKAEEAIIRRAVFELSPRDRELLLRRYWFDQDGPEIQQALELSCVVFKKAMSRARGRVRHLLRDAIEARLSDVGAIDAKTKSR